MSRKKTGHGRFRARHGRKRWIQLTTEAQRAQRGVASFLTRMQTGRCLGTVVCDLERSFMHMDVPKFNFGNEG